MASNVTAESVLLKIIEGHLECSICNNRFRRPKVLKCQHSFCLACLQELMKRQELGSSAKLTCPLCRTDTFLEDSGVEDLPNDFKTTALVEEVAMQEQLLAGQRPENECQNCDEENRAVSRCMECNQFLCQECHRAHERMSMMKSHRVYTLAQLQLGEITSDNKPRRQLPTWRRHSDQNDSAYGNTKQGAPDHVKTGHFISHHPEASSSWQRDDAERAAKAKADFWKGRGSAMTESHRSLKKPEGTWELKTEIDDFEMPFRVASFSDNEMVVCSRNRKLMFTFSLPRRKHECPPFPKELPITGLSNVRCVAVNNNDHLIVLDCNYIKVFDEDHEHLHQFSPGGPNSRPTCLAVDDGDEIAVGYQDREEVSLHNPDGSLIKTLPAPIIGEYLAMSKRQLIYTNYEEKRLISIDYSGARLFSVDMTNDVDMRQSPKGVCCDTDGSIYVAVWGPPSGDIHRYSPSGKYLGCVIMGCSSYPYDITFASGGDLAVAAIDSVQIYCRM